MRRINMLLLKTQELLNNPKQINTLRWEKDD